MVAKHGWKKGSHLHHARVFNIRICAIQRHKAEQARKAVGAARQDPVALGCDSSDSADELEDRFQQDKLEAQHGDTDAWDSKVRKRSEGNKKEQRKAKRRRRAAKKKAEKEDEILTEIRIPKPEANSGGAYTKVERKVGDYAISAAAVQLRLDGDTIKAVRIGLTNVSAVPMRAKAAEAELVGKTASDDVLEAAGRAAAAECDPSADLRGSVDYKRDLTRVVVKRSIQRAVARAKGGN